MYLYRNLDLADQLVEDMTQCHRGQSLKSLQARHLDKDEPALSSNLGPSVCQSANRTEVDPMMHDMHGSVQSHTYYEYPP